MSVSGDSQSIHSCPLGVAGPLLTKEPSCHLQWVLEMLSLSQLPCVVMCAFGYNSKVLPALLASVHLRPMLRDRSETMFILVPRSGLYNACSPTNS